MKYYLIIFFAITFISCEQKRNNTFEKFPNEYKLQGIVENEILYELGKLEVFDTLLVVAGVNINMGGEITTIYNLNNMDEITQAIMVGDGLNEVNFPTGARVEFGNVYVYDMARKKLYQYDILDLIDKNEKRIEYDIDDDLMFLSFQPEQEYLISCPNRLDPKSLLTYIGYDGQIKKSIPNKTKAYPGDIDEGAFQSFALHSYAKHPTKELYAFSFRFTDKVFVIDSTGEIINSCQGPIFLEQTPSTNENQIEAYRTTRCNNDFIYASYLGEKLSYSDNNSLPELSIKINIFDWDCQPVAQLILDHDVMDFDIDEKNNKLITWCPTTGTIVTYKLPNLKQHKNDFEAY